MESQLWFLINQINLRGLILLILICDCKFQAKTEASIEWNLRGFQCLDKYEKWRIYSADTCDRITLGLKL